MSEQKVFTLINPETGNLVFRVFSFDDNSLFDHLQRLSYYSIIIITEGSGNLKADFASYDFKQNSMFCFAPYQPFMIDTQKEFGGVLLNFHPDFFCIHKHQKEVACNGVLFNDVYKPPIVSLEAADLQYFFGIVEQMKEEIKNTETAQYELLVSSLKIFLIKASRLKIAQHPQAKQDAALSREHFILQDLKDAVEEHYKTKHSAGDYAALLNISPKALAKITKAHFNKTLTDIISERIVIEAKRELYLTSRTVKEIGYELGFDDEYYFSRFFKTNADVSPQLFRNTVGFARGEA